MRNSPQSLLAASVCVGLSLWSHTEQRNKNTQFSVYRINKQIMSWSLQCGGIDACVWCLTLIRCRRCLFSSSYRVVFKIMFCWTQRMRVFILFVDLGLTHMPRFAQVKIYVEGLNWKAFWLACKIPPQRRLWARDLAKQIKNPTELSSLLLGLCGWHRDHSGSPDAQPSDTVPGQRLLRGRRGEQRAPERIRDHTYVFSFCGLALMLCLYHLM